MWRAARWRQGRQHDKGGLVAGDLGLQFPHQQRMQGPTLPQHRRLRPHVINVCAHVTNVCGHVINVCAHVITVCVLRLSAAALTLCRSRSGVSRWRRRVRQQSGWRSSRDVWRGICSGPTKRIDRDSVSGESVCLRGESMCLHGESFCLHWVNVSGESVCLHSESVSLVSQNVWWVDVSVSQSVGESVCLTHLLRLVTQHVGESVCLNGESVCLHSESVCLVSQRVGESICLNCESVYLHGKTACPHWWVNVSVGVYDH